MEMIAAGRMATAGAASSQKRYRSAIGKKRRQTRAAQPAVSSAPAAQRGQASRNRPSRRRRENRRTIGSSDAGTRSEPATVESRESDKIATAYQQRFRPGLATFGLRRGFACTLFQDQVSSHEARTVIGCRLDVTRTWKSGRVHLGADLALLSSTPVSLKGTTWRNNIRPRFHRES